MPCFLNKSAMYHSCNSKPAQLYMLINQHTYTVVNTIKMMRQTLILSMVCALSHTLSCPHCWDNPVGPDCKHDPKGNLHLILADAAMIALKAQHIEGGRQNLRQLNCSFTTIYSQFFGIYIYIFQKTEVQSVILRC